MKNDPNVNWSRVDVASLDLHDWRVAVVGGTGGLGQAISQSLAQRGAQVTVVGQTFRDAGTPGIHFVQADLSRMKEAERIAQELPAEELDLVLFTTGIFAAPKRQETAEGIKRDMAVSYLSRLVVMRNIAARLGTGRASKARKPRVFIMGYPGTGQSGTIDDMNAEQSYGAMPVHMNTVAGNEMLVLDGAQRYSQLNVFGLNPGLIKTNIRDNLFGKDSIKSRIMETIIGFMTPSPAAYAARITPLLVTPDIENNSGAMFNQKGMAIIPSEKLADRSYVTSFLVASEKLVARASVHVPAQ